MQAKVTATVAGEETASYAWQSIGTVTVVLTCQRSRPFRADLGLMLTGLYPRGRQGVSRINLDLRESLLFFFFHIVVYMLLYWTAETRTVCSLCEILFLHIVWPFLVNCMFLICLFLRSFYVYVWIHRVHAAAQNKDVKSLMHFALHAACHCIELT